MDDVPLPAYLTQVNDMPKPSVLLSITVSVSRRSTPYTYRC